MSPELDDKLVRAFPIIYRDRYTDPKTSNMCFGFEFADGWFNIIWELSEKLESIARKQPEPKPYHPIKKEIQPYYHKLKPYVKNKPEFIYKFFWGTLWDLIERPEDRRLKVTQAKETYGELRVYLNDYSDQIDEWIDEAEEKSVRTCEVCGADGWLHGDFWLVTLCDKHWEEYLNR